MTTEMQTLEEAQESDEDLRLVRSWLGTGASVPSLQEILTEGEIVKALWHQRDLLYLNSGLLCRRIPEGIEQVLVPRNLREEFMKQAHTGITGGHLGVRRTRLQIQRRAYWVGWSADVKRFCRRCARCCQYHRGPPPRQGPLQPILCGEPWEWISVDITGPHPRSRRGHIFILTMMDNFSKFEEAVVLSNQEASTVAKALVETVVVRYGVPPQILSDQGTNFDGIVFKEMCRLLDIDKLHTTSYHPQANGLIERFHRTLNSMLGKVVSLRQHDWDDYLPYVTSAYRASTHQVTGYSPNYIVFGHDNRAPIDVVYGLPRAANTQRTSYSEYATGLVERLDTAYRLVRQSLGVAVERRKRRYDLRVRPAQFSVGQKVWYLTPRRYVGLSAKWQRQYTGPLTIVRSYGPVTYLL